MKTTDILIENITQFNPNRFIGLMKIEFLKHKTAYFISILIPAILYTLAFSIHSSGVPSPNVYFKISLFIGIFFTAGIFKELRSKDGAGAFLMTPASSLEKWGSKMLISSIGYYLAVSLVFFVFILLFALVRGTFSKIGFIYPVKTFFLYMFFHALFFFGAIRFKKMTILKTLLITLFVLLALAIVSGGFGRIGYDLDIINHRHIEGFIKFNHEHSYIKYVLASLLTLLLYWASYAKLVKKEVS